MVIGRPHNLPCLQGRGTGLKAGGGVRLDKQMLSINAVGALIKRPVRRRRTICRRQIQRGPDYVPGRIVC